MDNGWYQGVSSFSFVPLNELFADHETAFDLEKDKGTFGSSVKFLELLHIDCITILNSFNKFNILSTAYNLVLVLPYVLNVYPMLDSFQISYSLTSYNEHFRKPGPHYCFV